MTRRIEPAALVIAAVLLVLAAAIFWDMSRLEITSTYGLGPKAMPVLVASGLAVLALANLAMAWTAGMPQPEPADAKPIVLILGGLFALIVLIRLGGGFIPATAILFASTAAAFGRRAFHIDVVVGLVLGTAAYLLFDRLLTLGLPAGPLERLL